MKSLVGHVVPGLGRASEYLGGTPLQLALEPLLGYLPFPGTLNLSVRGQRPHDIDLPPASGIIGYYDNDGVIRIHSYHACVIVSADGSAAAGHIQRPLDQLSARRSKTIISLVSAVSLRETLRLSDGSAVTVTPQTKQ